MESIIPALAEAMTYSLQVMRESGDPEPSSLGRILRTDELREAAERVFPDPDVELCRLFDAAMKRDFELFLNERRKALRLAESTNNAIPELVSVELRRNRSLICLLRDRCLLDGLASHHSEGYVDVQCLPPWSTWVAVEKRPSTVDTSLLCWVPLEAQELVNFAVRVEPLDALCWVCVEGDDIVLEGL